MPDSKLPFPPPFLLCVQCVCVCVSVGQGTHVEVGGRTHTGAEVVTAYIDPPSTVNFRYQVYQLSDLTDLLSSFF